MSKVHTAPLMLFRFYLHPYLPAGLFKQAGTILAVHTGEGNNRNQVHIFKKKLPLATLPINLVEFLSLSC